MADDDTYVILDQLKRLLQSKSFTDRHSEKKIFALCYGLTDTKPALSCGKYPRGQGPFYPAGGGGMVLTRNAMLSLVQNLDMCYGKYANCWAGDRRLGACMWDSNVDCVRNSEYSSRDIQQDLKSTDWKLTTVHHVKPKQMIVMHSIVQNHTLVTNKVLNEYWPQLQTYKLWV